VTAASPGERSLACPAPALSSWTRRSSLGWLHADASFVDNAGVPCAHHEGKKWTSRFRDAALVPAAGRKATAASRGGVGDEPYPEGVLRKGICGSNLTASVAMRTPTAPHLTSSLGTSTRRLRASSSDFRFTMAKRASVLWPLAYWGLGRAAPLPVMRWQEIRCPSL
jgi:hypothetical protein